MLEKCKPQSINNVDATISSMHYKIAGKHLHNQTVQLTQVISKKSNVMQDPELPNNITILFQLRHVTKHPIMFRILFPKIGKEKYQYPGTSKQNDKQGHKKPRPITASNCLIL